MKITIYRRHWRAASTREAAITPQRGATLWVSHCASPDYDIATRRLRPDRSCRQLRR